MRAIVNNLRYYRDEIRLRYVLSFVFIHINKTGGSSIESALGLPFRHRTAAEMRHIIGERRWARKFSFTFVRNPWDKVASHYHYRIGTNQTELAVRRISFSDWVKKAYGDQDPTYYDARDMFMPQMDWITDQDGKVIVDFVGRFEKLNEDFRLVCERIGSSAKLPHLKKSRRRDYRSLYDTEACDVIRERFSADLKYFGYEFE